MSKRLLALCCVSVALTGALAACGSSDTRQAGPAGEVEEAIDASLTTDDPADCERLNTPRFLWQLSVKDGEEAVEACEEKVEDGENPDSVGISQVKVEGNTATATVTSRRSGPDEEIEVALVRQGNRWKLDEIVGFVDFARERLVEDFEKEVEEHPGELPPEIADCVTRAFKQLSGAELEKMLHGSSQKALRALAIGCAAAAARSHDQ